MAKMMSMHAVAEDLDVTVRTVRRMVARGELQSLKVGRYVRIPIDAYQAWKTAKLAERPKSQAGGT